MLDIYEEFFLPLGKNLIPCLSGILISILPGLEEEGSEFYERVLKLVDNICSKTDKSLFYRALWKSLVLSPTIRTPTVIYLNNRIPKEKSPGIFFPPLFSFSFFPLFSLPFFFLISISLKKSLPIAFLRLKL